MLNFFLDELMVSCSVDEELLDVETERLKPPPLCLLLSL